MLCWYLFTQPYQYLDFFLQTQKYVTLVVWYVLFMFMFINNTDTFTHIWRPHTACVCMWACARVCICCYSERKLDCLCIRFAWMSANFRTRTANSIVKRCSNTIGKYNKFKTNKLFKIWYEQINCISKRSFHLQFKRITDVSLLDERQKITKKMFKWYLKCRYFERLLISNLLRNSLSNRSYLVK